MNTIAFVIGYVLTVIGIMVVAVGLAWAILKVIAVLTEEEKL